MGLEAVRGDGAVRYQLTDRDSAVLAWLAEWRMVTAAQVARRWNMSLEMARRRLRALRAHGLVAKWQAVWAGSQAVYTATRDGLVAAERPYTPTQPRSATWHHELHVVDVAVALERSGREVVSERAMRSEDVAANPNRGGRRPSLPVEQSSWAVRDPGAIGDRPQWHYPDLATLSGQGVVAAYEVELTVKAPGRTRAIMSAYRNSHRYRSVWWLAGSEKVHGSLGRAAEAGAAVTPAMRSLLDHGTDASNGDAVHIHVEHLDHWLARAGAADPAANQ